MRHIGDILLFLVTGFVYWWWTWHLSVFGVAPNFIFLAALSAAVMARPVKAAAWCFFLGLYLDMLGAGFFGAYALIYTLMAYCVYVMKRHFDMSAPFSQFVAAPVMSAGCMLLYQALLFAMAKTSPLNLKNFLVEPFLNALAAPAVFYCFAGLKRKFSIL